MVSPLNDLQLVAFRESTADLMLMEQFGQRLHVKVVVVVHFFVCRDQKLRQSDGSSHWNQRDRNVVDASGSSTRGRTPTWFLMGHNSMLRAWDVSVWNESAKSFNNEVCSCNWCSTHPQMWWGSGRAAGQSGPQGTDTGRTLSAFWRGPVTSGPRCPLRRSPAGTTRSPQTCTRAPGRLWGPPQRDWLHWASQLLWWLQCPFWGPQVSP